eukprot:3426852-Rhodomonas_salina.10
MSGTEMAHGMSGTEMVYGMSSTAIVCCMYGMSGTEMVYGMSGTDIVYVWHVQCCDGIWGDVLCGVRYGDTSSAVFGTGIAQCYAVSGTELAFGAIRSSTRGGSADK